MCIFYNSRSSFIVNPLRFTEYLEKIEVKLFGIYISQPAGMAAMEKNLLFNDVIVVKEFSPTNPDVPEWYKNYEKGVKG